MEDVHLSINENITLKQAESYTYTLPENKTDKPFIITVNPKHAAVSSLELDNQSGRYVYHYTPISNYTGTDLVVIENGEVNQGGCGNSTSNGHGMGHDNNHHGNCDEKVETTYTVNLNFTIKPNKRPQHVYYTVCPSF